MIDWTHLLGHLWPSTWWNTHRLKSSILDYHYLFNHLPVSVITKHTHYISNLMTFYNFSNAPLSCCMWISNKFIYNTFRAPIATHVTRSNTSAIISNVYSTRPCLSQDHIAPSFMHIPQTVKPWVNIESWNCSMLLEDSFTLKLKLIYLYLT